MTTFHQLPLWPKTMSRPYYMRTLDTHIERAGRLFQRFQFSRYGIPPGSTRKVLTDPEKYWRRVDTKDSVFYEPTKELKKVHDRMQTYFSSRVSVNDAATAYGINCSIVHNAEPHCRNRSSLSLDMRNAFESIKTKHVYRYLCLSETLIAHRNPNVLNWQLTGRFNRDEAWVLSRLLTYRGRLRKGSPVSPFVFNMLCETFDAALKAAIAPFTDMVYTRYGDDLSFSSPAEVFPQEAEVAIRATLKAQNIVLNEKKTKHFSGGIMEFPGAVVVNGRTRPRGEYIAKVSAQYKEMTRDQRQGHRGFILQFGRRAPKILKKFLVPV